MKHPVALTFSLAVSSLALLSPQLVHAAGPRQDNSQAAYNVPIPAGAASEAKQLVSARVVLEDKLEADKVKPGDQFKATLSDTVHLKDGVELKRGTILVGVVSTDQMQKTGTSSLALRFTEAKTRSGKEIPITATIMSIGGPGGSGPAEDYASPMLAPWDGITLQVDELKAVHGADLHSRVDGANSGVFIANDRDNVTLAAQSRMILALGPQNSNNSTPTGGD